jgi:hypothetical protein
MMVKTLAKSSLVILKSLVKVYKLKLVIDHIGKSLVMPILYCIKKVNCVI